MKAEMSPGILLVLQSNAIYKLPTRQKINHWAHPKACAGNESSSLTQFLRTACAVIICLTRCPSAEDSHYLQPPAEERCEWRHVNDNEDLCYGLASAAGYVP